MSDKVAISINVISDVVCPWCYLAKHRLEAALEQLPEIEARVMWRPYLINADAPPEGLPHKETLAERYGGRAKIDAMHAQLTALGADVGIDFDFDAVERMVNSVDAHRLMLWAEEAGVENEMAEILFRRYFSDGEDVSSHPVLVQAAEEAGLDGDDVADWLATDVDRDKVLSEVAEFQRRGVTGVPFMVFENKYGATGAQDVAMLVSAIRDIAEEKRAGAKN